MSRNFSGKPFKSLAEACSSDFLPCLSEWRQLARGLSKTKRADHIRFFRDQLEVALPEFFTGEYCVLDEIPAYKLRQLDHKIGLSGGSPHDRQAVERRQTKAVFSFLSLIRGQIKVLRGEGDDNSGEDDLETDVFDQKLDIACNMTETGLYSHLINTILSRFQFALELRKKNPQMTKDWPRVQNYYELAIHLFHMRQQGPFDYFEIFSFLASISDKASIQKFDALVRGMNQKIEAFQQLKDEGLRLQALSEMEGLIEQGLVISGRRR